MRMGENWRRFLASKQALLWVTMGISVVLIFGVMSIHGFLAANSPVGEGVLVVEAWVPAKTLAESVMIFNAGRYRYLVVVGGPIEGSGGKSHDPPTYADSAASRLEKLGFDTKKLVKIIVPSVSSGRTLAGATAVKRWLGGSSVSVCCVDVFTMGVHARKSWVLFRYALGEDYRVGIIAGSGVSYGPRFWLVSRRGIWVVVRSLAGYAYSKLWILFHGKASPSSTHSSSTRMVLVNLFYDVAMRAQNRLAFAMAEDLRPHGIASIALVPGFMRTELVAATYDGDQCVLESVEYVGRAVAKLAADPAVLEKTSRTLMVGDLAVEYGFTDIGGRVIPPYASPASK